MGPVETVDHGDGPLVLTCEHATNHLPDGWHWGPDAWLSETHWAWDPGAAVVTRELALRFGSRAVLAGFSRLVVDPNRPLDSDTLIRRDADGQVITLNASVDEAGLRARIDGFWRPFHDTVDRVVGGSSAPVVLSVHSFTPVYEGHVRDVQIGVLYDREEALGTVLADRLSGSWVTRHNEPWSGRGGLMYSPDRHATAHGRRALEIELRQDLLADPRVLPRLVDDVEAGIRRVLTALGR